MNCILSATLYVSLLQLAFPHMGVQDREMKQNIAIFRLIPECLMAIPRTMKFDK